MKYNPKLEVQVFEALQELGEATLDEIYEYLTEKMNVKIEKDVLLRYIRRWKAKKVVAISYVNNETVYKMADIPPWYASGIMAIVRKQNEEEMREALEALDKKLKEGTRVITPRGIYGNYKTFVAIFETVDKILGGRIGNNGEEELQFPTEKGKPIIPPNWFRGLIRDNAALADLPKSIAYHFGFSSGEFLEEPKLETVTLKVKQGIAKYQAVPSGTKFRIKFRAPMRGTTLKTKEQLEQFFHAISEAPLRGLGANPYAYGGRIRLLELKEAN